MTPEPSAGEPRRRLLFLLPFPPDPDGAHGASRMTGQLLWALADGHEVGALYLRAGHEPPIDRALGDRLALAVEVERPSVQGPGRTRRSARRASGLIGRQAAVGDRLVGAGVRRARFAMSPGPGVQTSCRRSFT